MATLIRKLIDDKKDLWLFAGMIIIAANAGGAWSPIGDVTTIMLWIGGQVTAVNIILRLLIPSLVCMLVPLAIMSYRLKGNITSPQIQLNKQNEVEDLHMKEKKFVLFLGLGALLFVPVFKTITHLPPFLGILFGLSILWGATELLHKRKEDSTKRHFSIERILSNVDTQSILFFLGILLAVAALQSAGHLRELSLFFDRSMGDVWIINILIGFLSSLVDNVPLVAGAIGMYDLSTYAQDNIFWELLAYCAGTGGSCLIIGSAAGVAIMGILKMDFIWYLKNISFLAVIGYLSGVLAFWLMNMVL
jgi:Na+/H+ antiporter NhaD/arsenite permease-like protein